MGDGILMIVTTEQKIKDNGNDVFTLDYGLSPDIDPEKRELIKKKFEETLIDVSRILQGYQ